MREDENQPIPPVSSPYSRCRILSNKFSPSTFLNLLASLFFNLRVRSNPGLRSVLIGDNFLKNCLAYYIKKEDTL